MEGVKRKKALRAWITVRECLCRNRLHRFYVTGGGAFLALLDVERDALTLVQGLEPVNLDRTVMNEHVFPVIHLDKPEAFLITEPLYCTF